MITKLYLAIPPKVQAKERGLSFISSSYRIGNSTSRKCQSAQFWQVQFLSTGYQPGMEHSTRRHTERQRDRSSECWQLIMNVTSHWHLVEALCVFVMLCNHYVMTRYKSLFSHPMHELSEWFVPNKTSWSHGIQSNQLYILKTEIHLSINSTKYQI